MLSADELGEKTKVETLVIYRLSASSSSRGAAVCVTGQPLPRAAALQHVPRGRHRVPGRCGENPQPTA